MTGCKSRTHLVRDFFMNDRLLSVPETFYDDFLRRSIAQLDGTFPEGAAIGAVLGRLNVRDCWFSACIDRMVAGGELEVVDAGAEDEPACYRRRLKRTGK